MKISIITVNYNDKEGLERTINSVINQTWKEFEFIVIDGGSTDGSKELIQKHNNQINFWCSEPDTGVFNAMNKGIKKSKGEFVIFMNGGDVFFNNRVLEEVHNNLTPEHDIYYGNCIYKKINFEKLIKPPKILTFYFFYSKALNHQSTFIKKTLFDNLFYYSEHYKIASDWEFFIYAICHKNVPYKHLEKTISIYDFTGISSNIANAQTLLSEKEDVMMKYFPAFLDDYKNLSEANSKRLRQVFYVREHKNSWKALKLCLNIILLFLPKNSAQGRE